METVNLFDFEVSVCGLTFVVMYVSLIVTMLIALKKGQARIKEWYVILIPLVPFVIKLVYNFILGDLIVISPWVWVTTFVLTLYCNISIHLFIIEDKWISDKWLGIATLCHLCVLILFSFMLFGVLYESMLGRMGFIAYCMMVCLYAYSIVRVFKKR